MHASQSQPPLLDIRPLLLSALRFYMRYFRMYAMISLVIFVPVNFTANFFLYSFNHEKDAAVIALINLALELILGTFKVIAVLYATASILDGYSFTLLDTYKEGLGRWSRVLLNRIKAWVLIMLGFTFLIPGILLFDSSSFTGLLLIVLGMIPGIYLAIRYTFVDIFAIFSEEDQNPLELSRDLVEGFYVPVFAMGVFTFGMLFLIANILSMAIEGADSWLLSGAADCVLDVLVVIVSVVIYFIYSHLLKVKQVKVE